MTDSLEPVWVAWSGGKDSCLALQALRSSGRWRPVALLTTVTEEYDRISMHGVRSELLRAQARSIGLPLHVVRVPPASSNATYEDRMLAALTEAKGVGVHSVAFGDLFLADIRAYREEMLGRVDMRAIFPLWHLPTRPLAERFVAEGHRAVLTCVDTDQLDGRFAGRPYDLDLLRALPEAVDPCGENGEFHTFVHAGPALTHPISFRVGRRVLRDQRFMYADLRPAPPD